MVKVLVIGGAGFVGNNLVRGLLKNPNYSVTVFDSLEPRLKPNFDWLTPVLPFINFVQGDMRSEEDLKKIIPSQDIIYVCAAQTSHPLSLKDPVFDADINCIGNLKILEEVRKSNPAAFVIYLSTSTVIGRAQAELIDECQPERPLDIYSANKAAAEKYYQIYHTVHGLKTMVLRFGNLFGPYGKPFPEFSFINYFLSVAWDRKVIKLFGEADQLRNVMYIDDVVDLLMEAPKHSKLIGQIVFATSPFHYSVREVAETIVKVFERGSIETVEWPAERKSIEVGSTKYSSQQLENLTGWNAKIDLRQGLLRTKNILLNLEPAEQAERSLAL